MDQRSAREDEIRPFYYFTLAFSSVHFLVGCALFVRQRNKFPISGHSLPLTIIIGVRVRNVVALLVARLHKFTITGSHCCINFCAGFGANECCAKEPSINYVSDVHCFSDEDGGVRLSVTSLPRSQFESA